MSERSIPAKGTGPMPAISTTRMPESGPLTSGPGAPGSRGAPAHAGLAQLALEDLARRLPRQLVDELDGPRALVVGETVGEPGAQGVLVGDDPGPQGHDGVHPLTHALVGQPDDGGVEDVGVLDQRRLHLGRVDVHPAAQDEVGAAVRDEEVAVLVEPADVAGREVVAAIGTGGLLGVPAVGELVAAHRRDVDPTDLARTERLVAVVAEDADLQPRERPPDAARLEQPLARRDHGAHALGGAV